MIYLYCLVIFAQSWEVHEKAELLCYKFVFFFFILCLAVNCDGVLQSTVLAGHALRPDFDMSAIVGE